ncbi:MAG: MraY family glycosyltransferase [Acidimicrobiales bacterium]
MAGVAASVLLLGRPSLQVGMVCCAGLALGAMGLVDDDVTLPPRVRLLAELAAAVAAASLGITVHVTGNAAPDFVITLVWIVGITNALNLLDNMDGLAAGVAAVVATAVLVLAVAGEQHAVILLAAALAGACAGFLVHNRRPASIFMGDAGSLFLGFILALITIEVSPALRTPDSFAVPVMLLAVAVLDTTTVTLGRIRHGRSVLQGGKDHLSHRLVKRGLSMGLAVWLLIAVEAVAATLAVLAGRELLSLRVAAAAVLAGLALLVAATWRANVYDTPATPLRTRLALALRGGRTGADGVGVDPVLPPTILVDVDSRR